MFVIGFAGFVVSLLFATKTFNIKKYIYQSGSTRTVLKDHKHKNDFLKEEIDDLVSIVQANNTANNLKGTSLIRAARYFTLGLFAVGLLGIVLTVNVLFIEKKEAKFRVSNQLDITSIETSLGRIGSDFDSLNVNLKKLLDIYDKARLPGGNTDNPREAR